MWEFLTTVFTTLLNKEVYMALLTGLFLGIVIGGLAAVGYFTYTGSTLKFKKDKV